MTLRVGVFSEDGFVSEALPAALARNPEIQVVCLVKRLGSLKSALQRAKPDVLVLDADLASRETDVHPLALVTNSREVSPKTRIVMLITQPSIALINMLLRELVNGVVVKDKEALPEVLRAIEAVRQDITFLCRQSKPMLINAKIAPKLARGDLEITHLLARREKDMALTRKDMARELVITEGTLNSRIAQLRVKLNVTSDEEIVALCRACGLIE